VVSVAAEEELLLLEAPAAGAELLDELLPEEQAARVAPRDRTPRIPTADRVIRFIYVIPYQWTS
jgi:hypothetical protein